MKKKYSRPTLKKIKIDNQISLVMMTSETDPPENPFGSNKIHDNNTKNPFKA